MMSQHSKTKITVEVTVFASVERVWRYWTTPADIVKWNTATDSWHTPHAENNVHIGGRFNFRMEARLNDKVGQATDGSQGFDFSGVYDNVILHRKIDYTLDDGRKVNIIFLAGKKQTKIVETFDAETENPVEMQHDGWQAILNNFKQYVESK